MDKEEIKLLTRKTKHTQHRETKMFIDWTGVTPEELKVLARRALVYGFQIGVTKDLIPGVPEVYAVVAKEAAADRTPHIEVVFAPKAEKCRNASHDNDLEYLISQLSAEERELLFAEVTGE